MAERAAPAAPRPLPPAGLCAGCRHAELRASPRSTFLRCARAAVEPRFPRFPTLPVLACAGFEPGPRDAAVAPGTLR
jgi:hypothetical protein